MKIDKKKVKNRSFGILIALLSLSSLAIAQNTGDYKKDMDKWWQDYATYLKKIDAEPNDHTATLLIGDMKTQLVPRFGKLIKETQDWKKSHSKQEVAEMEKWTESNPHAKEVQQLTMNQKVLMRAGKNKEFGSAYGDFNRSLAMAGKAAGR